MQASLDIINWNELLKFKDSLAFAEWRLEQDEEPDWILSHSDAGWRNDSGSTYSILAEGLSEVAHSLSSEEREHLKKSHLILLAVEHASEFPCISESCYVAALSPDTVQSVYQNMVHLDREALVDRVAPSMEEWPRAAIVEYFEQLETSVKIAIQKRWGILVFLG